MSQIKTLSIDDLSLDLHNFRTVPQKSEAASVHALISLHPEYFWALTESLAADGWHGTENVIVLHISEKGRDSFIVKEGNRRIGALKLLLGKIARNGFAIPAHLEDQISAITPAWRTTNSSIPCNVFESAEEAQAERLVSLTHAKGEKAGRLSWNAVARARYNRDKAGGSEPALDLLERYLKSGKNLTPLQKERWGGEYPLSVLAETLKRLCGRLSVADSKAVASLYPKDAKRREAFEDVLHGIGVEIIGFPQLRNLTDDVLAARGFPAQSPSAGNGAGSQGSPGGNGASTANAGGAAAAGAKGGSSKPGPTALPSDDPRSVIRALKQFSPKGAGREKLVLLGGLKDEFECSLVTIKPRLKNL